MAWFLRSLHVLAVALWFGSVAFFTVAGLLIFQAFEETAREPAESRPLWFPVPSAFDRDTDEPLKGFPHPMRLEQGSRAAGVAVSKIFPVFYALQAGCAAVALVSAIGLMRMGQGTTHRLRILLVGLGLLTVLVGWWLERKVHDLRVPRNELTDQMLKTSDISPAQIEAARSARATFGMWHGISLLQNFVTLAVALVLCLLMPEARTGPN